MSAVCDSGFVRVLDLDGSLTSQDLGPVGRLDWRALGSRIRYMCSRRLFQDAAELVAQLDDARVTLFGSGDYHHLTYAFLQRQADPFSLVLFDQHPDWNAVSTLPGCGSWVNSALDLPQLQKVVIIGVRRADGQRLLPPPNIRRALADGRLEIYPYAKSDATVKPARGLRAGLFQVNAGISTDAVRPSVEETGLDNIVSRVLAKLPSERVYVSIDKDVLAPEWAISNWGPGRMQLGELTRALSRIRMGKSLVGADITGEWSPGEPHGFLVRTLARMDHPPRLHASRAELAVNAATNRTLLRALGC